MKTNKKGIQLNEAFGAILTIILVALLVIVSIVIFTNMNTATATALTATTSVNESLGNASTAVITLTSGNSARDGVCGALTRVMNTTGNAQINLANFSQTACTVSNASTIVGMGATYQYSYPYTYTAETSASNASNTFITQFVAYPALIGLVGTIIFLALVIGVLIASFAFGKKGV